ncbi:hypothetical protein HC026_03925 [Lactobacillus sp. LC28-10]|uniref:Mga helix-turn-helix domain-containing protein n=1 Tax=Secundilactobacillus angelensis TaxID=2722706 RepID=A0ABX1KXW1_9LACO|nr:hypothetical protein [Secundilactobacillus angelensis]MCH5462448.1 hypothetical protein [Secundilactobacillus angelensis]NLR18070.1 hypothetical protein [Secundilactobacillus angelensis]
MIKNQDPQATERLTHLTLLLVTHAPKHVPLSELTQILNVDSDTIRHDLNWVTDFLAHYSLVVDPSVDQQVAVYGQENYLFRATLDLLKSLSKPGQLVTAFPISDSQLEKQLTDRLNELTKTTPLDLTAQQSIYDYLWTLAMRYRFGRVKRLGLAELFTPGQLALISNEKKLHPWSQKTIEVLENNLPDKKDMPLVEGYLLTMRVWLYAN